jgi:hypothetical protein
VFVATGGHAATSASLYVSAQGSDSGSCTASSPCSSLGRAYSLAQPGQVVEVAGGTYPSQKISPDPAKASGSPVVFRPAAGALVRVQESVDVFASNVTFAGTGLDTGFVFGGWSAKPGARGLTFEAVNTGIFSISGASNITVRGGQVGPWPHGSDSQVTSRDGVAPTNILIDGVYFHDVQRDSPDDHTECLQFGAGQNIVIRNNRFLRCSDHDVFIRSRGQPGDKLVNFTIEDNFFGATTNGFYTGQFSRPAGEGGTCDNVELRDNVLEQGWTLRCSPPNDAPEATKVSGNYWAFPDAPSYCSLAGVWEANIFEKAPAKPCDAAGKLVPASRELPLRTTDAVRRVKAMGFRCGAPAIGARTSATVCTTSGKRFATRVVVAGSESGRVQLVKARLTRRSGTVADAARVLGSLAGIPVQGRPKLIQRAKTLVARGVGRTADASVGAVRVRVYTADDDLALLLSAR